MNDTTQPTTKREYSYSRSYKWIHWILAFLFTLMLFAIIGFSVEMSKEEHIEILTGHSTIGTLISIIVLIRIYKRFIKRDIIPNQDIDSRLQFISKTVQYSFYFFMLYVPITGYLSARLHELPVLVLGQLNLSQVVEGSYNETSFLFIRQFHEFGTRMLIILLILHVAGTIFHKFVKKDDVLKSMTTGKA